MTAGVFRLSRRWAQRAVARPNYDTLQTEANCMFAIGYTTVLLSFYIRLTAGGRWTILARFCNHHARSRQHGFARSWRTNM